MEYFCAVRGKHQNNYPRGCLVNPRKNLLSRAEPRLLADRRPTSLQTIRLRDYRGISVNVLVNFNLRQITSTHGD